MRFRSALAVALGTGMLILATPALASAAATAPAAGGEFTYHFTDSMGIRQVSVLVDPPSGDCITLPEVADPATSTPADAPRNRTDESAVVFTEPGCQGDYFTLRPLTGYGSDRLKLRSVVFG